jgi:hypothetical protein
LRIERYNGTYRLEFLLCTLTPEVQCQEFHRNHVIWRTKITKIFTEWKWFETTVLQPTISVNTWIYRTNDIYRPRTSSIYIYRSKSIYHIFCCNMFVFACPIIAKSQCWLFVLRTNTGQIQISVCALIYPYLPPNSTSGICAVVSKIICQCTKKDDA